MLWPKATAAERGRGQNMLRLARRALELSSPCAQLVSPTALLAGAAVRQVSLTPSSMVAEANGVEAGVQALTLDEKAGTTASTKSHADFLAERQPFYAKRIELFEKYMERENQKVEAARAADVKCKVVLPDGTEKEAVQGVTTPMDIARGISPGLAKKVVVAQVDGKEWDINRPFVGDSALKLFGPDTPEGMDVRPTFHPPLTRAPLPLSLPSP